MANDPKARPEFDSHFATLTHNLNRMRRPLRGESGQIAQQLRDDEETSLQIALGLGGVGLFIGVVAFVIILRTLQPLRTLRARARQVAGGDYARRTAVPSHDEIGELVREFDVMAAAIQEREQRLIRSERLATVGRMAAQITHEVRNPLASIGLYAELLGDEIADKGPEPRRLLASIASEVDRLTEITENYLRFARFPQAKLEREDLGAIAASVLEFSRAELAQAGITLDVDVARRSARDRRRREPAAPGAAEPGAQRARGDDRGRPLAGHRRRAARSPRPAPGDGGGGRRGGARGRARAGREPRRRPGAAGRASPGAPAPVRQRAWASPRPIGRRSSTRSSRPRTRGPGWAWRWCSRSSPSTAARIDVESAAGQGTTITLTFPALSPGAAARCDAAARRPRRAPETAAGAEQGDGLSYGVMPGAAGTGSAARVGAVAA